MDREKLKGLSEEQYIEIILELVKRIAELEAQMKTNSGNSSKPPSTDGYNKPTPKTLREQSGKKPGGQKGHLGHGLKIEQEPDEIIEHKANVCMQCGEDTSRAECTCKDTRTVIDFDITVRIIAHKQMETVCPACGAANAGEMPKEATRSACYGAGVQAFSVLLSNYTCVSVNKIQNIFSDVFGIGMSQGTIINANKRFAENARPILEKIKTEVKKAKVINNDETGINNQGNLWWIHTASTPELTYMTAHPKRGEEGINDNGVLLGYTGIAVHDCMRSYFKYRDCIHALCNAHLLRELEWVCDFTTQTWAAKMIALLLKMKAVKEKYIDADKSGISCYYGKKFVEDYEEIIILAKSEVPYNPVKGGQHKSYNLLQRFIERQEEITHFVHNFDVPFDNNQAERDIRNVKNKQKVAGSFRSDEGVKGFAKISSIIGTAVKQGLSVFDTLKGIVVGDGVIFASEATE